MRDISNKMNPLFCRFYENPTATKGRSADQGQRRGIVLTYGLSFDANFGFPTLMVSSELQHNLTKVKKQRQMISKTIYSVDMGGGKSGYRVMSNYSPTLDCAHQGEPVICYCYIIDPLASNSMKSKNPHSGFHKSEYSPTLDTSTQNPIRNGGGLAVVQIQGN